MSRRLPARILLTLSFATLSVALMAAARVQDSPHLKMGNPSHATADPANKNNFLMVKPFYALSYNNVKGTPNWVSWRLSKEDLGNAPRFPFKPDADLPAGFKKVTTGDYSGAGF